MKLIEEQLKTKDMAIERRPHNKIKSEITKIVKLVLASLFMIVVYLLIPILVKYYIDWVIDKSIVWIVITTLFALTIPRIVLNYIPIVVGKLTTNKDPMIIVSVIINWSARILYFVFIFNVTDFQNKKSIMLSIFMFFLFYAFCSYFTFGIMKHISLQEEKEEALDELNQEEMEEALLEQMRFPQISSENFSDLLVPKELKKKKELLIELNKYYYQNRNTVKTETADMIASLQNEVLVEFYFDISPSLKSAYDYGDRAIAKAELYDPVGAISDFNKATILKPDYENAFIWRGEEKYKICDYQGAILDYLLALKLNSNNSDTFLNLGKAKLKLGIIDEAVLNLNTATALGNKKSEQVIKDMKQPEESARPKPLTLEQTNELATYPSHWRSVLQKAAERGESIKETYEELKDLEHLM